MNKGQINTVVRSNDVFRHGYIPGWFLFIPVLMSDLKKLSGALYLHKSKVIPVNLCLLLFDVPQQI